MKWDQVLEFILSFGTPFGCSILLTSWQCAVKGEWWSERSGHEALHEVSTSCPSVRYGGQRRAMLERSSPCWRVANMTFVCRSPSKLCPLWSVQLHCKASLCKNVCLDTRLDHLSSVYVLTTVSRCWQNRLSIQWKERPWKTGAGRKRKECVGVSGRLRPEWEGEVWDTWSKEWWVKTQWFN